MIYINDNENIYIPCLMPISDDSVLNIVCVNNLTNEKVEYSDVENLSTNPLYFEFEITPGDFSDNEYTIMVFDGDLLIYKGLMSKGIGKNDQIVSFDVSTEYVQFDDNTEYEEPEQN